MTVMRWLWAALAAAMAGCSSGRVLYRADFAAAEPAAGWSGALVTAAPRAGEGVALTAQPRKPYQAGGHWASPPIPIQPFQYVSFESVARSETPAAWSAVFLDAAGRELQADNHDLLPVAATGSTNLFYIRGHALAQAMRIRFFPGDRPLVVQSMAVREGNAAAAAAWADRVMAAAPPVPAFPVPAERDRLLPRTMKTLREGGRLRIVVLGDSIANDTSNSLFETLLRRRFPRARLEVATSVRSATGCWYYDHPDRIRDYVFRYEPDLVIVAGISHRYDAEAVRNVLRRIREGSKAERLVLSDAIAPAEGMRKAFLFEQRGDPAVVEAFPARLRVVAAEEGAAFADMRTAWDGYVKQSGLPHAAFLRDVVHANTVGKQVAGRLLAGYFSGAPAPEGTAP